MGLKRTPMGRGIEVHLFKDLVGEPYQKNPEDKDIVSERLPVKRLQAALGEEAVAADGRERPTIEDAAMWVACNIGLTVGSTKDMWGDPQYYWSPIPSGDPFLQAHREEVILEAVNKFKAQTTSSLLSQLIYALSGKEYLSDEMIEALVVAQPRLILDRPDLCPHFRFNRAHIESIIDVDGVWELLMRNWRLIEPECLQYAVNEYLENGGSEVDLFIHELPASIKISEQHMAKIAAESPATVYGLLKGKKFPEARSSVAVLSAMSSAGYTYPAMELISDELLNRLSFAKLVDIFGSIFSFHIIDHLVQLGRLDSEEMALELVSSVSAWNMILYAKRLPGIVQSCIFKAIVTTPDPGEGWAQNLDYIGELQTEDYEFLISNIDACISEGADVSTIENFFELTGPEMESRYELEVLPKLRMVEAESQATEARNDCRQERRDLENEYFQSGNVKLTPHDYDGQISDQQVIDGLEHGHCVRAIGVLKDIANDPTRTNMVPCLDSLYKNTTTSLGANVDVNELVTLTEHEALRQLMKFLEDSHKEAPDDPLFETLSNDLSFIGEKEYAEAAKGIAMYWKWFLDQDDNNQLYVDTVVSTSHESIKSDTYMFDRILEHFSDDDMEKYWGRLLTKGADIIQDDPSKVKVVLLDDWTISGAQMKSGYSDFARKHPKLISSIEVQLIAASSERVAMGIEEISYRINFAQTQERNVPIVTRAYYLAHNADTTNSAAKGARITGAHSSVDYGFASDLYGNMVLDRNLPLLANVIRGYRQTDYVPKNIERLKKLYGIE